jgi:hypothetical protein
VRLHVLYGMLSLVALRCLGLCLIKWLICLLAGGLECRLMEDSAFTPYVMLVEGT